MLPLGARGLWSAWLPDHPGLGARPGWGGGQLSPTAAHLGRGWAEAQRDRDQTQPKDVREEREDEGGTDGETERDGED